MEKEKVLLTATLDVTIVLPAGESAMVYVEHAENIVRNGYGEIVEVLEPSERKPAAPKERK
jgi:hypothetical protein